MTMTYKFIAIDDEQDEFGPARHIEHTINGEQTWPELVERFEEFLKGVGYIYDGHLEMVEDEPRSARGESPADNILAENQAKAWELYGRSL
jgi:hypothetical protein